jgi:hypothetical protein
LDLISKILTQNHNGLDVWWQFAKVRTKFGPNATLVSRVIHLMATYGKDEDSLAILSEEKAKVEALFLLWLILWLTS